MALTVNRRRVLRAANRFARKDPDRYADWPDAHIAKPSWIVRAWTHWHSRWWGK